MNPVQNNNVNFDPMTGQPINNQNVVQPSVNPVPVANATPAVEPQAGPNNMNVQGQVPSPQQPVDNNVGESTPKKGNKKLFIIGGIVLAVVAVVVVVILLFSKEGGLLSNILGEAKEHKFVYLYEDDNGVYYFVDENDKVTSFSGYDSLDEDFDNGVSVYKKYVDGKTIYGIIDEKGKDKVQPGLYSRISRDASGIDVFEVEKEIEGEEYVGIINSEGKIIVPIEYDDVTTTYFSDSGVHVFLVEKDEQFKVLSANGTYFADAEDPGFWGTLDINQLSKISDDSVGIIEYNEKFYNYVTGEQIDIKYSDDISYHYKNNVLFEEEVGVTIYDKNGKVKEKVSFPNASSFDVYKTKTNHIVVTITSTVSGWINDKYTTMYRIYDADFNLLKESTIDKADDVEVIDVNDKYFYLDIDASPSGTKDYSTILFDSKLNETLRESDLSGFFFETVNGDIIYTEYEYSYYSKEETFYDVYNLNNEKLHRFDKYYGSTFTGALFVLYDKSDRDNYAAINLNGEVVASGFDYKNVMSAEVVELYNDYNESTLVFADGKKLFFEGYNWDKCGDMLIAYNKNESNRKIYDIKGNPITEYKTNNTDCLNDEYYIVELEDKSILYDAKTLQTKYEFKDLERNFYHSGVNILEFEDGFYNYDGKLVLSKQPQTK